jgi:hypothetical protein
MSVAELEFSGTPTNGEQRTIQRLGIPRFVLWFAPLYAASVAFELWQAGIAGIASHPWHTALRALMLTGAIAAVLLPRFSSGFRSAALQKPILARVTEQGINWEHGDTMVTLPWWGFTGWRRKHDTIVLLAGVGHPVYLTKSTARPAHGWDPLLKTVASKVPRGNPVVHLFV